MMMMIKNDDKKSLVKKNSIIQPPVLPIVSAASFKEETDAGTTLRDKKRIIIEFCDGSSSLQKRTKKAHTG
jgi:hypothetical protein